MQLCAVFATPGCAPALRGKRVVVSRWLVQRPAVPLRGVGRAKKIDEQDETEELHGCDNGGRLKLRYNQTDAHVLRRSGDANDCVGYAFDLLCVAAGSHAYRCGAGGAAAGMTIGEALPLWHAWVSNCLRSSMIYCFRKELPSDLKNLFERNSSDGHGITHVVNQFNCLHLPLFRDKSDQSLPTEFDSIPGFVR